jgi:hypothetical protein
MPVGYDSLIYLGRVGIGTNPYTPGYCYGVGTDDPSLAGTYDEDGTYYCYDPAESSQGGHGYPYEYHVWAYDLHDLAAVRAGTKQPWEVTPYGEWSILADWLSPSYVPVIGGAAYDPGTHRLFVAQVGIDGTDGMDLEPQPLIHVFQVVP